MVTAVVFDVGETLLDDTREYGAWADWIGVPRHTFSAVLGAVIAAGRRNTDTFQYFRPGFDVATERQRREETGAGETIEDTDLYPDVRPALSELRARGLWVAIAGNQTAKAGRMLRALDLPADAIATSGEWGATKPDQAFFDHVAHLAPADRSKILYVGDHRDHDILPAHKAGMRTAHIRRGPVGHLWANDPAILDTADWRINSLTELPDLLRPPA
ncbi:HAD family hydrolase [Frankia sp. CNm7]|uniref:HAD family hydrolase n=1 Tax=Frankia nepalensis TaxID=1836974 RepID=A0A937RE47_9ACTN|nr:HAD family hydrolase [Frankia nepalensis]MBL7502017.1 HAD family hydrolase [Frankia nepalensis]MBL7510307.1 HAD family hydrolase [Frankia nepalensis]MBL7517023.1 HAD family hydrolase [Frankia nepalensis]MBL7630438.1 HAD family hydrolase [Frankia nepalensis]